MPIWQIPQFQLASQNIEDRRKLVQPPSAKKTPQTWQLQMPRAGGAEPQFPDDALVDSKRLVPNKNRRAGGLIQRSSDPHEHRREKNNKSKGSEPFEELEISARRHPGISTGTTEICSRRAITPASTSTGGL